MPFRTIKRLGSILIGVTFVSCAQLALAETALLHAIRYNDSEEAIRIIDETRDRARKKLLTKPNSDGFMPLHLASSRGSIEITEALVDAGADVEIRTKGHGGLTPLHLVARDGYHSNHWAIARLLLDNGANANARSKTGLTPLHLAAEGNHIEVAELIVSYRGDVRATDKSGTTPLMAAAAAGRAEATRYLLGHGVDIEKTNDNNQTALHLAAARGRAEVVSELLDRGARPDSPDGEGRTPLHLALLDDHFETGRVLVNRGALPRLYADTVEDRFATAMAYQLSAAGLLAEGHTDRAMKQYRLAESGFAGASVDFEKQADNALTMHKVSTAVSVVLTVAAIVAAAELQQDYATSTNTTTSNTYYYAPPPPPSKPDAAISRYRDAPVPGQVVDNQSDAAPPPVTGMSADANLAAKYFAKSGADSGSSKYFSMAENSSEETNEEFVEDATYIELAAYYGARSKHSRNAALFCRGLLRCQELLKPGEDLHECIATIRASN